MLSRRERAWAGYFLIRFVVTERSGRICFNNREGIPSFSDSDKPKIAEDWRLRNDVNNLIAYKCSVEKDGFRVLSPIEAMMAPLFDGTNTLAEIRAACCDIYGYSMRAQEELIDNFIKIIDSLNIKQELLSLDGERSPSLSAHFKKYIPDFTKYNYPANRLERPLSAIVAFTNNCCCHCRYCYAERGDCEEMPLSGWIDILDELAGNEIFLVDIGGGDIFSRIDAYEILKEMVMRDLVFLVSTKSFISIQEAGQLADMGIGLSSAPGCFIRPVQVSIDSINNGIASFLTGHSNYLEQATKTINNLIKAGISPRVKSVLTSYNFDAPEQIVKYFSDLGVTRFQFSQYGRSKYRHRDELFLSNMQKQHLHEMALRMDMAYPGLDISVQDDTSSGGSRNLSWERWRSRALCSGGRTDMVIQPNGDVSLCEQIAHREEYIVGNVFRDGVLGVWNSERLLNFIYPSRDKFAGTVCYECDCFDECHQIMGYCYRDTLASYGTVYDAQPECPRQNKLPVREI